MFLACARWHSLQAPPPPADVWEGLLRCVRFHTMDLAYLRATVVRHPALRASPKLAAAVARLASPSAGKAARRRSNKRPLDGTPERAAAPAASSSSSAGGETSAAAVAAPPSAEAAPSPSSSSAAATATATAAAEEEALAVLLDAASPPRKRVALLRSSNGLVFKYTSAEVGETDRHEVPSDVPPPTAAPPPAARSPPPLPR